MPGRKHSNFFDRTLSSLEISRRQMLVGSGLAVGGLLLGPRVGITEPKKKTPGIRLRDETKVALYNSSLVYVSPLRDDGRETTCHGEVWFFYDEGDVVIATATDGWKSRAIKKEWMQARIWVGDFGPVKKSAGKYRTAPSFGCKASFDKDPASFARLMETFADKYEDEWSKWKPRFESGYKDGSRVLIRYTPIAG